MEPKEQTMERHVITVFGGSGFIGRHLVRRLAAGGAIIRVAVRDVESASFLKPMGNPGQIVPFGSDVTDPGLVAVAVDGAETVINLVGILSEWGRRTFQRLHVDGPANVAAAARAAGVGRLLHMSALGADKASASAYARTKALGEDAVRSAFPEATIFRPSVVFGPEDRFFNTFAEMARFSPFLPVFGAPPLPRLGPGARLDVFGRGGPHFQPIYVADVAEAFVRAGQDSSTRGRTYELGGPHVYSFKEIMELVSAETRRPRLMAPVPFWLAGIMAWFLEKWPQPMLTRDQVELLKRDNVVGAGALTLKDMGIEPAPAEAILPTYLARYRPPRLSRLPSL